MCIGRPKREGLNILVDVGENELTDDSLGAFDDFDDKPSKSTEKGLGKVINLDADDMPAAEVIKYVCDQLGIVYRLEEYAVILTDQHYWGELETRFYAVSDAFVEASRVYGEINFERAFKKIGMTFPPGAKIKYVESANRLVMTNADENHVKLQYFIKVFE